MSLTFQFIMNDILLPLYYIGGIVVGCSVLLALKQLKLTREQIKLNYDDAHVRSKREAIQMAATQCDVFAKTIILQMDELIRLFEDHGGKSYDGEEYSFDIKDLNSSHQNWLHKFYKIVENDKSVYGTLNDTLNKMEVIAIYFTEGIASDEIAFPSIGKSFCFFIKYYYPYVLQNQLKGRDFEYIVKLFSKWNARFKERDLLIERQAIDAKLGSLDSSLIKTIGI
jgi:hypothetical protein